VAKTSNAVFLRNAIPLFAGIAQHFLSFFYFLYQAEIYSEKQYVDQYYQQEIVLERLFEQQNDKTDQDYFFDRYMPAYEIDDPGQREIPCAFC